MQRSAICGRQMRSFSRASLFSDKKGKKGTFQVSGFRSRSANLRPVVDERPVEKVSVVGDDNLRPELRDMGEEPADQRLFVGLVEDVERPREGGLRRILEVLRGMDRATAS